MFESKTEKTKRLLKNTLFLYFRMLFVMGVSFFTSRIVLDKLGFVDYGIQNVVSGMAAMFIFFRSSLANASQRFLSVSLAKNDLNEAKNIFCQHQTIYIVASILVLIFSETIGLWFVLNKLIMPPERLNAAMWVYQFFVVSLVLTLLSIVYDAVLISHENMRIYSYVGIYEGILKLVVAFMLSIAPFDRLIFYGLLLMLVSLSIRIFYGFYCKKNYEECTFKIVYDKHSVKKTMNFVGWNFVGTAVWAINNQGLDILLNLFFGPVVNAAKAVSTQVCNAITNFTTNFFVSVQPQITKSYANSDFDYLMNLFYGASKYSFFLLWFLCLPVILHADFLLNVWLKDVPEYAPIFVKLILGYSLVNVLANPIWSVALASGKLKKYICIGSGVFLMSFPIAYVLLKNGMPPTSVLITNILVRFVYVWVVLIIIKAVIPLSFVVYCKNVFIPISVVAFSSSLLNYIINQQMPNHEMFASVVFGVINMVVTIICIFFVGLGKKERAGLLKIIKKRVKNERNVN